MRVTASLSKIDFLLPRILLIHMIWFSEIVRSEQKRFTQNISKPDNDCLQTTPTIESIHCWTTRIESGGFEKNMYMILTRTKWNYEAFVRSPTEMLAVLRSFSLLIAEWHLAEIANENNDSRVITFNREVHFVSRISDSMKEKLFRWADFEDVSCEYGYGTRFGVAIGIFQLAREQNQ